MVKDLLGVVLDLDCVLPAPLNNLQVLLNALIKLKVKINLSGISVIDLCDLNKLVAKLLAQNPSGKKLNKTQNKYQTCLVLILFLNYTNAYLLN